MDQTELQNTFIDSARDQPILHPCFRLSDVKLALSHIEYNLGLIPQPLNHIAATFFYLLKGSPIAIMVTPVRYDEDRMSYAFQVRFLNKFPQTNTSLSDSEGAQSYWHVLPVHIYLQMLQKVEVRDVKPLLESLTAKGLLPEQSVYLEPLNSRTKGDTEYSWEDVELLLTLEKCGFPTPSYSEFSSLLFWGIGVNFVRHLASYGYNYFSFDELETIWRCKIPLKYLKALADTGYGFFTADEYHTLYASQISPATVISLSNDGHTLLSCKDLVRIALTRSSCLLPV